MAAGATIADIDFDLNMDTERTYRIAAVVDAVFFETK
jgi:hypothetical protein